MSDNHDNNLMAQPVTFGDLVEATATLRESIEDNFAAKETTSSQFIEIKQGFDALMEFIQDQTKYFSAAVGAMAFVLAANDLITADELDQLTRPDFDVNKFIDEFVARTYDIDLAEERNNDDDLPIGKA